MRIRADKQILLDAVVPAQGFTSTRSTIAVVEGILFRTLDDKTCQICAYDLEKGFTTQIGCIVEEPGSYAINASKLVQIIKSMPAGIITVEVSEKNLRVAVTGGRSKMEMTALPGDKFPDFPNFNSEKSFSLTQKELKSIINKTKFAIAVNHTRPELNGLYFHLSGGELNVVSCDGNRLAVYTDVNGPKGTEDQPLSFSVIIPGKTILEILRFIGDSDRQVKINVARKHVIFFIGEYTIFTRIIEASYIDYKRFIPVQPKTFVELDAGEFTSSLERAMFITEDRQQGQTKPAVICNFSDSVLKVHAYSVIGRVDDEIPIEQDGEAIEIAFNCRFLYEAMQACDTERTKISLTSGLMGMTIEPIMDKDGKSLLILVLPVRLPK
ncbi:MAG: DNA polymerase III subunit beta [Clostridia bacterium]|nr:DNA polymerase III subunit beta [Clostridia bacterium]